MSALQEITVYRKLCDDVEQCQSLQTKCLLICTAIDILVLCYHGEPTTETYANRYRKFIEKFGRASRQEAEILYQFRAALVHTYGAFAFNPKLKKQYSFQINTDNEKLIKIQSATRIHIHAYKFEELWKKMESNYLEYVKNSLGAAEKLQAAKRILNSGN